MDERTLVGRLSFILGSIACVLSFVKVHAIFLFLIFPMSPLAVLFGIIGFVVSIKYKLREIIYSVLGIIGGIIPIIRFLKFCEEVSSIRG